MSELISLEQVYFSFPDSEALHDAHYLGNHQALEVSYKSQPQNYYTHELVTTNDVLRLFDAIRYEGSAHHGYEAWKKQRREEFQAQDVITFSKLWNSLNKYQQDNLYKFVNQVHDGLIK